jgi:DNA-binding LacI/PurR family transcriptional regulator
VQALIQSGCEKIELWKPVGPQRRSDEAESALEREIFRQHLRRAGKTCDTTSIKTDLETLRRGIIPYETHSEQGFRIACETFGDSSSTQSLGSKMMPDGILVTDDMMTVGLLRALQLLNLRVGKDIIVATHSNLGSPVLSDYEDVLIRLEIDPSRIVRAMFDILETLLRGEIPAAQNHLVTPKTRWPIPHEKPHCPCLPLKTAE